MRLPYLSAEISAGHWGKWRQDRLCCCSNKSRRWSSTTGHYTASVTAPRLKHNPCEFLSSASTCTMMPHADPHRSSGCKTPETQTGLLRPFHATLMHQHSAAIFPSCVDERVAPALKAGAHELLLALVLAFCQLGVRPRRQVVRAPASQHRAVNNVPRKPCQSCALATSANSSQHRRRVRTWPAWRPGPCAGAPGARPTPAPSSPSA